MKRSSAYIPLLLVLLGAGPPAPPAPDPAAAPQFAWHLTARPWKGEDAPPSACLDVIEPLARAMKKLQNAQGQIIDPYEKREIQYSTAYFAYGVAVLVKAGRGNDLLDTGINAMDSATEQFSRGAGAIDNQAGEFVITPLTEAIALYAPHVPADKAATWKKRMSRPLEGVLRNHPNNWQTYAMRGEWLRANAGFSTKEGATNFIEKSWKQEQARRLEKDPWGIYHDESSDPDALAVDPVGRVNLMGLIAGGYDGPSAAVMKPLLMNGARSSLFLQDPAGQAPGGGRSSGHVWNDLVTLMSDEQLAEISRAAGDADAAGRCRRAADLALQSLKRWQRADGTFFVTKNRFDPADRIGYSQASFFTNYNAAILFHLAELYERRRDQPGIAPRPAPSEVGGYVIKTDPSFASVVANAGGLQVQGFLRGATKVEKNQYWTTLGITRFSRADGWDGRLGNIEATRNLKTRQGVSFAPTFKENGQWVRLSDVPERYQGQLSVQFAGPVLARFTITYAPTTDNNGPTFHHEFILSPDGLLTTLQADGIELGAFGLTLPLLENDGAVATDLSVNRGIAAARYADGNDQLAYLALKADGTLDTDSAALDRSDAAVRGAYGDVRPVRWICPKDGGSVFIYLKSKEGLTAAQVADSFLKSKDGFSTALGRVAGNMYIGKTALGGYADRVELDDPARSTATFDPPSGFVFQLGADGTVSAVESDRDTRVTIVGKSIHLKPFMPVILR